MQPSEMPRDYDFMEMEMRDPEGGIADTVYNLMPDDGSGERVEGTLMRVIQQRQNGVVTKFSDIGIHFDDKGAMHVLYGDAADDFTSDRSLDGFDVLELLNTLQHSNPGAAKELELYLEQDYTRRQRQDIAA